MARFFADDPHYFWPTRRRTLIENATVKAQRHHLPGNELPGILERLDRSLLQATATGNLHAHHRYGFDVVTGDDMSQLGRIINRVELGTADQRHLVPQQVGMEASVGIRGTIGCDKQMGILKIRCPKRGKLDLERPVAQLGLGSGSVSRCRIGNARIGNSCRPAVERADCRTGASSPMAMSVTMRMPMTRTVTKSMGMSMAERCSCAIIAMRTLGGMMLRRLFPVHMRATVCNCSFVIGGRFTLNKRDGAHRTRRQAIAEAIAVILAGQLGHTIDDLDRSLMAGMRANAASVAFPFIDLDDFTDHRRSFRHVFQLFLIVDERTVAVCCNYNINEKRFESRGRIGRKPMKASIDCSFLARTPLFKGLTADRVEAMLASLQPKDRSFEKNERIFRIGETTEDLGIVLSGKVRIEQIDVWGNVSVVGQVGPGAVFGEVYAAIPDEPFMVDAVAAANTQVLFLNVARMLGIGTKRRDDQVILSANLLNVIAHKNLNLSRKIAHVSPRTIRGKLLAYLSWQSQQHGSMEFDIPFDRQQLADYLGVDRSALSAELGGMQKSGILQTRKSHFKLSDEFELE